MEGNGARSSLQSLRLMGLISQCDGWAGSQLLLLWSLAHYDVCENSQVQMITPLPLQVFELSRILDHQDIPSHRFILVAFCSESHPICHLVNGLSSSCSLSMKKDYTWVYGLSRCGYFSDEPPAVSVKAMSLFYPSREILSLWSTALLAQPKTHQKDDRSIQGAGNLTVCSSACDGSWLLWPSDYWDYGAPAMMLTDTFS